MGSALQILTGENWVDVMHSSIRAKGTFSFLYFAAITVFGRCESCRPCRVCAWTSLAYARLI